MASVDQLLGNTVMGEKDPEEVDGSNLADGALEDHIAHWAEVLDRWVTGIDRRLGRQDGAAGVDGNGSPPPAEGGSQPLVDGLDADPGAEP
jgi:hypothetical protein